MTGALAYVALMSVKNRFLMTIRKLRNARYLISALFGLGYMLLMFSRSFGRAGKVRVLIATQSVGLDVLAGVIFVLFVIVWAWPSDDAGVAMSESEIQFLFAGPLRRRDILLYRFFRAQVPLLISAVMTSLFAIGTRNFIGMWFFMASLSLYLTMVQQLRARLRKLHIGFLIRLVSVIVVLGGASWWAVRKATFDTPLIKVLLFIPRFFAMAALPSTPLLLRLGSMLIVTVIGALCFFVSASINVDFEEGSIALSQKKANAVTRSRSQQSGQWMAFKRLPPPFRLGDTGAPEIAIVWKNLIASLRIGSLPILILFGALAFLSGQALFIRDARAMEAICGVMLFMTAIVPLAGANVFSQDLRLDIMRIEYLKTFPISGERIVASEIAAPLIVMSVIELIHLTVTAIFLNTLGSQTSFARFATPQIMLSVFIFTIPVCAILTVMRNAAVLLFPSWTVRSKEEPRGFVVTGQRLVVAVGNLMVLAVAVLPAAVVFLPAVLIANRYFSGSPAFLAIATLPPLGIIAAEVWISVKMLGKFFDTFDASNELDRILT
jgi:ABC-2 type transport system permease protein